MISWVHEGCKQWGAAQYRILYGHNGWPSKTLLGKLIQDGIIGAGYSRFTQDYPEVIMGENLIYGNAIKKLPEYERSMITIHYVFRGSVKWKAAQIEIPIRTYYAHLDRAQLLLANIIDFVSAQKNGKMCSTKDDLYG